MAYVRTGARAGLFHLQLPLWAYALVRGARRTGKRRTACHCSNAWDAECQCNGNGLRALAHKRAVRTVSVAFPPPGPAYAQAGRRRESRERIRDQSLGLATSERDGWLRIELGSLWLRAYFVRRARMGSHQQAY